MKQIPIAFRPDAPEQTFENFVAGANAAVLAHLAALPERAAPVYLWGPGGSGKTHLLHALTRRVQRAGGRTAWFSSRDLPPWPHDEQRALVVLDGCDLFDEPRQQAAFALFAQAATDGTTVVAAGRLPPLELPLREDLKTRLGWGHVFALQRPGEPEARAILRREADRRGIFLADEVMDHLLTRFARDLRALLALLDRLDGFALAHQRAVTVPLVRRMIAEEGGSPDPAAADAGGPGLVLFDLDHTLLPIDSDHAFGEFLVASGWVDETEFRRANDAFYAQYQAGTLDIHAYIAAATAPLRAHSAADCAALQARFMRDIVRPNLRPQALELVAAHRARGDVMVLVTATNDFVTAPIADAFGIGHLIAVRLERDADGRPTGRIDGTPSYRDGKVARVEQWLAQRGKSFADFARVTVYSDSLNDLALLERATEPVATNPSPALAALARERGWRILQLFETA